MDQTELLKITKWSKLHNKVLTDLYHDFRRANSKSDINFLEFTLQMYYECYHGSLANEEELPMPKTLH